MKERITDYLKFGLIVFIISLPVFGNLNVQVIRIWDESRLAINAYQMYQDHDWIVTHYMDNSPDMWNTKPPLLIWCQVFFMNLIGIGELAMRLPSAIAAFLTCLALLILSVRYLKDLMFGGITVIVLVTTYGYINVHASRTGDYDALLTFFTTVSAISFFAYTENGRSRYVYLFFFLLVLGVLTKSVSALLYTPAFLLYSLWRKQFIRMLRDKHFYVAFFLFLLLVLAYYLLREHYNPGYIKAVYENELGGRYLTSIENHGQGFWFYYNNMLEYHLSAWYLLVPCGILIGIFSENKKIKNVSVFSMLLVLTLFLVISTAKTKLAWYDCPLYPFISIIVTAFIHFIFSSFENVVLKSTLPALKYNIIPYLFLFLVFITPYQAIINKTYYSKENPYNEEFYQISYFMRSAINFPQKVDNCYLLIDGEQDQLFLYLKKLQHKGVHVAFKKREELQAGDTVIACQQLTKEYIGANYIYQNIENDKNISKYILISQNLPK